MTIIVTEQGFQPDTQAPAFIPYETGMSLPDQIDIALDLPNTTDPHGLKDLLAKVSYIRIHFPKFTDGRGYTLARQLRLLGYHGILRAAGELLADQYSNARHVGFDEVQISTELADRQPVHQWLVHTDWPDYDYQARLGSHSITPT